MEKQDEDKSVALNSRTILPVLINAIKCVDPINGLTLSDLYSYAKEKVDWSPSKLKDSILSAVELGLETGRLVKCNRYRFVLNNGFQHDGVTKLCGSCGGKIKKRMCCKKRRRPCPMKKKKACPRKRRACPKKRMACPKKRRACPKKKPCIRRCTQVEMSPELKDEYETEDKPLS